MFSPSKPLFGWSVTFTDKHHIGSENTEGAKRNGNHARDGDISTPRVSLSDRKEDNKNKWDCGKVYEL